MCEDLPVLKHLNLKCIRMSYVTFYQTNSSTVGRLAGLYFGDPYSKGCLSKGETFDKMAHRALITKNKIDI